jgi:autophagy-related protein 13
LDTHRTSGRNNDHDHNADDDGDKPIAGLLSTDSGTGTGPMLTSESEVDERLRQMNAAFAESLEGLGGRRRERRSSSSAVRGGSGSGSERSSEMDPQMLLGRMSAEGSGSRDGGGSAGAGVMGRGRGMTLPPRRPLLESRSTSTSDDAHLGQGFDEVLGRLSLDEERRRSRGQ